MTSSCSDVAGVMLATLALACDEMLAMDGS